MCRPRAARSCGARTSARIPALSIAVDIGQIDDQVAIAVADQLLQLLLEGLGGAARRRAALAATAASWRRRDGKQAFECGPMVTLVGG